MLPSYRKLLIRSAIGYLPGVRAVWGQANLEVRDQTAAKKRSLAEVPISASIPPWC